jgi:hypothetical protein
MNSKRAAAARLVGRLGSGGVTLTAGDPVRRLAGRSNGKSRSMEIILWIIAVILVISGIVTILRGSLLWGIVLIVVGLLVGPGGVSIFT